MNYDFSVASGKSGSLGVILTNIESAQLIRRVVEPDPAYLFKHVLVQDAVYDSLLKHDRKRLHLAVAETLERAYPDQLDEFASRLAWHYAAAGDDEKTCDYATRAAEGDRRIFADPEARLHYAQALDALGRLPDSIKNRRRKIDLWLRFFDVRWTSGTAKQDLAFLDELEQVARTLPAEDGGAGGDRLRLAQIHLVKGGLYVALNQTPPAMALFKQVLAEAQDLGDRKLLATPSVLIGGALNLQGFFAKSLPLVSEAWEVYKDQPGRWEWSALVYFTTSLLNLGRLEEARELVGGALASKADPDNTQAMTHVYFAQSVIAWMERSPLAMLESSKGAVQASRTTEAPLFLYIALAFQALAESYLGKSDAARIHMEESKRIRERLGGQIFFSDWVGAIHAEVALQLGDLVDACKMAEEAWNFARSIDGFYAQGLAQRTWAEALMRLQPPQTGQAEEHLAASLAAFESCEAPIETARTKIALARILQAKGEVGAARENYEQAVAKFQAAGLKREVEQALKRESEGS